MSKEYILTADLGGESIMVRAGQLGPRPLHLVGSALPETELIKFRGTHRQLLAISILADLLHHKDGAILRGKAMSWKLHRAFEWHVLRKYQPKLGERVVITEHEIREWLATNCSRGQVKQLEFSEERWRQRQSA